MVVERGRTFSTPIASNGWQYGACNDLAFQDGHLNLSEGLEGDQILKMMHDKHREKWEDNRPQ